MFWVRRFLAGLLLLVSGVFFASAQAGGSEAARGVESLTFADSALPIVGPWRFQPGDSPVAHDGPVWAEPGFDDQAWPTITLPSSTAFRESLPGWMGQGFPQVQQGYAWYRVTLQVHAAGEALWLKMPNAYDDAFQVYANGALVGDAGFQTGHPVAYYSTPHAFALPKPDAQGRLMLAVRFWLDPNTRFDTPDAGGMHRAPLIGLASTIRAMQTRDVDATVLFDVVPQGVLPFFFLLAAMASLLAWVRLREQTAYLWLGLRLLLNVFGAVVYDVALTGKLSQTAAAILLTVVVMSLLTPGWILFWWSWFGLRRDRWILWVTAALTLLDAGSALWARATTYGALPAHWAGFLPDLNTAIKMGELALLVWIFVRGFQKDRTEALIASFPLLLNELDIFNSFDIQILAGLDKPVLGMHLPPSVIASFVLVLTIAALAVRRFLAVHARRLLLQQALENELDQASELQRRVLLPGTQNAPFLEVSTAYLPAQTIGGDFFQVISNEAGSTLVLLGDISGKGVAAAFLVAVLVGAIRTQAELSLDPYRMLQLLNAHLVDRSDDHFATCLATLIEPTGCCTFVNAGHLPPYLNGQELVLPGALPLGVVPDAEFALQTVRLEPGDYLTLLSDGVVEATDHKGQLLGFERTRLMSRRDAREIAEEARSFGQADDITAVTMRFTGAVVMA